jgi:Universal stress protein UspA and related nucleotide-binding proteins
MSVWSLFKKTSPTRDMDQPRTVLLASEGRRFTDEAIEVAARLAREMGGQVRVLTIARMWGSGLGFPHPGLRPNKRELAEHEENVGLAIARLTRSGIEAKAHIVTSRNPGKSIDRAAKRLNCEVIVMGADPRRGWLVRNFMWSQEPYRIHRRATIPVHLVCNEDVRSGASVGLADMRRSL